MRNVQSLFARIIGLVPYLPEELQLAAANVDDPARSATSSPPRSGLRPRRSSAARGRRIEQRLREVSKILNRELEVFELGTKIQSQVQSELEKGQREFFLRQQLKAIQEELGEGDPEQADSSELRERLDALELPEDVQKAADRELARLERLPSAAAEYGVIRTYLDWLATLPWGVTTPDDLDLDARTPDPRRGPLRPREGEGADRRAPRRLEAQARPAGADPLLRRPARRRQDLARPVDRAHARAEVRAALGRRRPRRGGDPRPPPHVHRRHARHDHPRAARRRVDEPGAPDRRDRQDGRRRARRPRERDARGARPGAEPHLPRPLPRPPVRPLEDALHLHGEHGGHDPTGRCSTGWT